MSWSITLPASLPQPGEELCITITGGTGTPPSVTLTFDGEPMTVVPKVKDLGGGTYVACFVLPTQYETGRISVSGGKNGVATAGI